MRKFVALVSLAIASTLLAYSAHPQSVGTTLVMQAHWDNSSPVQGTVTLSQPNLTGPDTVIVTKTLSKGRTSVAVSLAANSLYNVTLLSSAGTQLVKFPITTALINPSNLSKAEIDLVVHAADNSLASAHMDVATSF